LQKHTRRRFFTISATACGTALLPLTTSAQSTRLKTLSKKVFVPSNNDTGVFPGFVTYTHATKPILLNRYGWVNASDTYDDFHETVSTNNGLFWSTPKLKVKSKEVNGGLMKYIEHSAFFDADTNILFSFVGKSFYPNGKFDSNQPRHVEITQRDPETLEDLSSTQHEFGQRGGMGISFCFPLKTKTGRIIVPGFSARVNEKNEFVNHPVSKTNIYDAFMLLGDYTQSGEINWTFSEALQADDAKSTRGFSECAICELNDGRIAGLARGSNARAPELPGYKWLMFSEDQGATWSDAKPMTCDDGSEIQSSATGSALFRSLKNSKLYFIGNLCADGKPANGNWPRSPLHIAEVEETTVSIKRDTITIIDQNDGDDTERLQISNFRYYQDREIGDVVIYSTRFGENSTKEWKKADHYEYRVALLD
jgi:hypothetical protein